MVSTLHKNGIRVILDVVFNHVYEYAFSSFEKTASPTESNTDAECCALFRERLAAFFLSPANYPQFQANSRLFLRSRSRCPTQQVADGPF